MRVFIGVFMGATLLAFAGSVAAQDAVSVAQLDGKVSVSIGGELFTEYCHTDVPRPFLYPVLGPKGLPVMRNYPMAKAENETTDHVHHRSLWFTHGDVNGMDFWAETEKSGTIQHAEFLEIASGETGLIRVSDRWVSKQGETILTDERSMRFSAAKDARIIDFDVTLIASHGPVVFGDTKEGSMAIRLAPTMRLSGPVAQGAIVTSEGVEGKAAWGTRAKWVDYYGPVQGQTVGVAIFDHPANPRHPTWWHVREYGLFAANPFGISNFDKNAKEKGDFKIDAGDKATFRYRFFIHLGDTKAADLNARYAEYAGQ